VYAIKEAINGMLRTRNMTLISIFTITLTLIVIAVLGVITLYVNRMAHNIRKSEEINVYIKDDMPDEDMLALDATISSLKEVESTHIVSKEDAAREFEKIFGKDLLPALDKNPLPRTIVVVMAESYRMSSDLEKVATRISNVDGIESVQYSKELMTKMDIFFLIFIIGEAAFSILIVISCLFIISNTISLTVIARRETIEIMRLVGAAEGFIKRPFYIEGVLQGILSGIIAFGVVFISYQWILRAIPNFEDYLLMLSIPSKYLITMKNTMLIIPFGGIMGTLGGYIAVRRAF